MSDNFHLYLAKLDELRVLRAEERERDEETDILDEMDEIWGNLTASEREDAREASWRAWPHQYAKEAEKRIARQQERKNIFRSEIDLNPGVTTIMINPRIRVSVAQPADVASRMATR